MPLSRGLREQLAVNEAVAGRATFTAMLLTVLEEEPEVREAVAAIARRGQAARPRRDSAPHPSSAAEAQRLKAARVAARGRGRRG